MRPDTEPNRHAKRIMAGAFVLTVGLVFIHGTIWVASNFPTVVLWGAIVGAVTFACYILGLVALDVWGWE